MHFSVRFPHLQNVAVLGSFNGSLMKSSNRRHLWIRVLANPSCRSFDLLHLDIHLQAIMVGCIVRLPRKTSRSFGDLKRI